MGIFKKLFGYKNYYSFKLIDYDDGEAMFIFKDENDLTYAVDLDWKYAIIDVEFGILGDKIYDTTNLHIQYKILRTVTEIVKLILKRNVKVDIIRFKSSNKRNGLVDLQSMLIRNRLFIRYITKEFPKSIITKDSDSIIYAKLIK